MQRRKFLVGMGSLAAGGAAAIGTGATTSIRAQRGLDVEVAGDASAHLEMVANTSSDFVVENTSKGTFAIDFTGSGVNNDGTTEVRPAFVVTNTLSQPIYVEVNNPLRNLDITTSQDNSGSLGLSGAVVPAGLDVQFIASDGEFVNVTVNGGTSDAYLIDRDGDTATVDAFSPKDPSTVNNRLNARTFNGAQQTNFNATNSGYIELGPGNEMPVSVRAVTNNFDVTSGSNVFDDTAVAVRASTNKNATIFSDKVASSPL